MDGGVIVMKERSEKSVRFKTHNGNVLSLVREVYLRPDIPCRSNVCRQNCMMEEGIYNLPKDADHYIMIDGPVAANYWEIFELNDLSGIIVTLSTLYYVQQHGGKRLYNRVKGCLRDPGQGCVLFDNEFHVDCFRKQLEGESSAEYTSRLNYRAACWYRKHLNSELKIVLITQDANSLENEVRGGDALVLQLSTYLEQYHPKLTAAHQLFESLSASLLEAVDTKGREYSGYLSQEMLMAGVKAGHFLRGVIHVNKYNSMSEATVVLSDAGNVKDVKSLRGEVLVCGPAHRNRAVHADQVCIELLPKSQWKSKSNVIASTENDGGEEGGVPGVGGNAMPTGRVVGVLQRNWRDYVCSLPPRGTEGEAKDRPGEKVLVTPWDRRVPRIRIGTSQASQLRTQRFIVRIDGWEVDSQYPHGHFVRSLGQIGDLETETQTILIEHNLWVRPFTEAQLSELPLNTPEQPWSMDPEEVVRRRDLRDDYLIFSIDPVGCQDVDDTLSIRWLPKEESWELGVHIADVTQFVPANSFLDLEGRIRSTSIYLADRRYDMLPHGLSGDLCSLWSGVDRYAVSVLWKLNSNLEVKDVWYGRSVIRSRYKLAYELAQKIYDGKMTEEDFIKEIPELGKLKEVGMDVSDRIEELRIAIRDLVKVASTIKDRRMKQGGLELEGLEVQVQFADPNRTQLEDLVPKQPLEMHETIAECMIFANHWVAKRILETYPTQSCLRRHPPPRQDYFDELIRCARARGFEVHTDTNKQLAESLAKCVDPADPEVNRILRTIATQAMSNAMYFSTGSLSHDEFAHYGLALARYTHFTSPIRRYADILVHRLLLAAIDEGPRTNLLSNTELESQCQHMNDRHRQAQHAQRAGMELFQALFFKSKSEDDACRVAEGVIYQLRTNGFIVLVPRYGIRGALYLKKKDGSIAWLANSEVTWLPPNSGASMEKTGDSAITLRNPGASSDQIYRLFDHVSVRLTTNDTHTHGLSLSLELIGRSSGKSGMKQAAVVQGDVMGKEADEDVRKEIFESVRTADEERRRKRKREELGSDSEDEGFDKLHNPNSLYHFFLKVKENKTS